MEKILEKLPQFVVPQFRALPDVFMINTPLRMAHFCSQCSYESMRFNVTKENLNYSSAALLAIFGKYFTKELADFYAHKPRKIGSRIYANRMGNGPEYGGEGFEYRGRGYIQLTGKDNYRSFAEFIDDDRVLNDPDLVSQDYPLLSAAWFWETNHINKLADLGATDAVVEKITRVINGGTHGLSERIKLFNYYFR